MEQNVEKITGGFHLSLLPIVIVYLVTFRMSFHKLFRFLKLARRSDQNGWAEFRLCSARVICYMMWVFQVLSSDVALCIDYENEDIAEGIGRIQFREGIVFGGSLLRNSHIDGKLCVLSLNFDDHQILVNGYSRKGDFHVC